MAKKKVKDEAKKVDDDVIKEFLDNHEFEQDHRKSNPGLHLLYVKWAIQHLTTINVSIEKISKYSNLNMFDILNAMWKEREKLIKNNAAYADAQEIISSIQEIK